MTTATLPPAAPAKATSARTAALLTLIGSAAPGSRLSLTNVRYADYVEFLHARTAAGHAGVRVAFDCGELEVMVIGSAHERLKKFLDLFIEVWIEEAGGAYLPCGGMTHLRDDIEKGFEPDECYYIQNWAKVAGVRDIDFATDPPPDLAVEIEVSRTVLGRLPIYAAFKIPEVWRYDGTRLTVLLLRPDGTYAESPTSRALPTLPVAEIARLLLLADDISLDYLAVRRRFREWVRTLPPSAPTT